MTAFLLDTTVLFQQFKAQPLVREWIDRRLVAGDELFTTVVNVAEALAGAGESERPYWDRLFNELPIFPVLVEDGQVAGRLRYDLRRRGLTIHAPDALIAAVAANRGCQLVTANLKDFRKTGLPVVHLDGDSERR
jgi:predicted nucleic acid-binding protein